MLQNPIHLRLERLESWQHVTFMACLCERMYPNYAMFCKQTEFGDGQIYRRILDLIWETLTVKDAKVNFDSQLEKFEEAIPAADDYDLYGVYPAIDACVALSELMHSRLSGEIRNPLSSIKGLAKYFAERTPAGGESHELAQVMAKEADRLNRVVSELLELVKPAHLTLQTVNLNDIITHSLNLVSQDAQSREIQLRFTANETLKRIQADPDRLTQVLLNLYLNAIHAIGRQGTISVEAKESGTDRVIITVTDSGKGIAPDQLEAIFTPYFTTKADGTGLGLAVVQNIIEQHGGAIKVKSIEGKGAVFTIWLPVIARQQD